MHLPTSLSGVFLEACTITHIPTSINVFTMYQSLKMLFFFALQSGFCQKKHKLIALGLKYKL